MFFLFNHDYYYRYIYLICNLTNANPDARASAVSPRYKLRRDKTGNGHKKCLKDFLNFTKDKSDIDRRNLANLLVALHRMVNISWISQPKYKTKIFLMNL